MFEQKARVSQIEGSPFIIRQREARGVALAKFHERSFSLDRGQSPAFGYLFGAALDADDWPARASRNRPRQLPQAAAHVEHTLAALQLQFAQRTAIEQVVEQRQARLFVGMRAVNVFR